MAWHPNPVLVITGVSTSGKSTLRSALHLPDDREAELFAERKLLEPFAPWKDHRQSNPLWRAWAANELKTYLNLIKRRVPVVFAHPAVILGGNDWSVAPLDTSGRYHIDGILYLDPIPHKAGERDATLLKYILSSDRLEEKIREFTTLGDLFYYRSPPYSIERRIRDVEQMKAFLNGRVNRLIALERKR